LPPIAETIVETTSLDGFFKSRPELIPLITAIKIDAEGAEMSIVRGMANIFKNSTNLSLILEYVPYLIQASGYEPEDVLYQLAKLGFKIKIIGVNAALTFPQIVEYSQRNPPVNLLCYTND